MEALQTGFNPSYQDENLSIDDVLNIEGYAILEFGANWCGHCKVAIPAAEQVLSKAKLPHIKVTDGKGKRLGRAFKVKLWPTLILLKSGKEVARLVRPLHADEVRELLELMEA